MISLISPTDVFDDECKTAIFVLEFSFNLAVKHPFGIRDDFRIGISGKDSTNVFKSDGGDDDNDTTFDADEGCDNSSI